MNNISHCKASTFMLLYTSLIFFGEFIPPLTIIGILTLSETLFINFKSYPFVPSLSTDVNKISPAPSSSAFT